MSYRPLTRFTRLALGDDPYTSEGSKRNFQIKSLSQISIFLELNALRDELSIETDQNLQKFLFTDSDGTTLRVYLDSYDDNSHDPLQLDSHNTNTSNNKQASSSTSLIPLETGPDAHNFIKTIGKIKIFLKSSARLVNISKRNFGIVNLYARFNRNPFELNQHNSFSKLNCNGQVLFNNEFVSDAHSGRGRSNLTFTTSNFNQNVFAYICSESFDLRLGENDHVVEFSVLKIN